MAFGSNRSVTTAALARAALLPAMPTLLRLCLDEKRSAGGMIDIVSRDLITLASDLAPLTEAWARAARETEDLTRTRVVVARTALVTALDRLAAERDDAVLRSLAMTVLAVSTAVTDAAICMRLGAWIWREVDELWRLDARVHDLGAASELWRYDISQMSDLDPEEVENEEPEFGDPAERKRHLAQATVDLRADARAVAMGLSALAVGTGEPSITVTVCDAALSLGRNLAQPLESRAASRERALIEERDRRRTQDAAAREAARAKPEKTQPARSERSDRVSVPPGHVLVCPSIPETGSDRGKSAVRGYEHVVNTPIPLVATPDLAMVASTLSFEFPYAGDVVERVLTDLVGRPTVHLSPILLTGRPGCGKSRFARRLAEVLGVGLWRVDGVRDTGGSIAGLDRRWHSAEPAHPLMAVARFGHANPCVLVDEIDKAPVRVDYGRLWDALLPLLESENASRFSDPCLQVSIDLSHETYIATANRTDHLPAPLLDRLRMLAFPAPTAAHLVSLLPAIVADYARERELDPRWIEPISGDEIDRLQKFWSGGSLRRLRTLTETVLRAREFGKARH